MRKLLLPLLLFSALAHAKGPTISTREFSKLPPQKQQQVLTRLMKSAAPEARKNALTSTGALLHRDRSTLTSSRYRTFRDGEFGTRELVSGSMHDGILNLVGKKGVVLDWELMRRYQATTPPTPAELGVGAERVGQHHVITSNVSEQPQLILDEKASATGKARVLDYDATVNKNALAVRAVMDAGVNVVKVGSQGLSMYEMYRFYKGLRPALFSKDAKQPRAEHNKPLQQIAGIGLIDVPRTSDVQFTHAGKPITLDAALELARQGRAVQVQQAPKGATLTDVDHLVTRAMAVESKDPAAAQKLREQANTITVRDAFQKARSELLVAKLSGLNIFLIDTQHKDKGFARFLDAFSDKQLVELADTAHEMGMDIWAAGSIGADGYARIVKAGWNLVCFGGAARDASGLRPENDFVSIDPAKVERLQQVRIDAEKSPEVQRARQKMQLLSVYNSTATPRLDRDRAWQSYQSLKGAE